jgi:hypothetical protein
MPAGGNLAKRRAPRPDYRSNSLASSKKSCPSAGLFHAEFDCDAIRELDPVLHALAAFARVIDFHPLVRQLSHETLTPMLEQECLGQEVTFAGLLFPRGEQSYAFCRDALAFRNFFRRERTPKPAVGWSIQKVEPDCAAFVVTKEVTVHAGIERLGLPLNVRLGRAMTLRAIQTTSSGDITAHVYRIVHSHGLLLTGQTTEMFHPQSGR